MNYYLITAIVCAAVCLLAFAIGAPYWYKKNKNSISVIAFKVLGITAVAGAITFVLLYGIGKSNYQPLNLWLRIGEVGYQAIWIEMLEMAVPFIVPGVLLPLGFRKINTIWKSALLGLFFAASVAAGQLFLQSLNVDNAMYAFLGTVTGFCILSIIIWTFPKTKLEKEFSITRRTHVWGVFNLLGIYFVFISALFINNGSDIVPLQLFTPDQKLPQNMTVAATLPETPRKVYVYNTIEVKVMEDAKRIGTILGIEAESVATGERAQISSGSKSLKIAPAGEWKYYDESADKSMRGESSDEAAIAAVIDLLSRGAIRNFGIEKVDVDASTKDENGQQVIVYKDLYITSTIDSFPIKGSCEIFARVGKNNAIISIDKNNADFERGKSVNIISAQDALKKVQDGVDGIAHTMFYQAQGAVINEIVLAYWLEEVRGMLQPIWLFKATAQTADGDKNFEIYVPAIK